MRHAMAGTAKALLLIYPLLLNSSLGASESYKKRVNIITSDYDLLDTTYIDRGRINNVRVGDRFQVTLRDGKTVTEAVVTGVFDRMASVKITDSWLLKDGQVGRFQQRPQVASLGKPMRRPAPDITVKAAAAPAAPAPAGPAPDGPGVPPGPDAPAAPGAPDSGAPPAPGIEGGLPPAPGAPDAGLPPAPGDAGLPPAPGDAGLPPAPGAPDAGLPPAPGDAGLPPAPGDAGLPPAPGDAGLPPAPDAGLPPAPGDAGLPPAPDAGLPPAPGDPGAPGMPSDPAGVPPPPAF